MLGYIQRLTCYLGDDLAHSFCGTSRRGDDVARSAAARTPITNTDRGWGDTRINLDPN